MKSIPRCCCAPIAMTVIAMPLLLTFNAMAQTAIVRVDGLNGLPADDPNPPNGSGWGADAFKFLQDALAYASQLIQGQQADDVQVWVRGDTNAPPAFEYRPDQDYNYPDGSDVRGATFAMVPHTDQH